MSVRNLGDWSPLGLDEDPIDADVDRIGEARKRYHKIAVTIDDAITRLGKIVDTGSGSLAGQYVESLKTEATSIRDELTKTKVRYEDVAGEIAKYQPNLDSSLEETKNALVEAEAAQTARSKAQAMADPQAAEDGTIPPEENQKRGLKDRATEDADGDLAQAKNKLNNAMNDLNDAGKSFGDAVNSEKYDDGLSKSGWDKFLDFLENIGSKILGALGVVLGILVMLIPGVNLILASAVVVASLTLVVDITLYANDRGSLADVILSAVGLALMGGTAIASVMAKSRAATAQAKALLEQQLGTRIGSRPGTFAPHFVADVPPDNPATKWKNLSDWFNNPLTNWFIDKLNPGLKPTTGFGASTVEQWNSVKEMWRNVFSGNFLSSTKEMLRVLGGLNGIRELAAVQAAVGQSTSFWWSVWGAANAAYTTIHGILYTGLRLPGVIPPANPGKS